MANISIELSYDPESLGTWVVAGATNPTTVGSAPIVDVAPSEVVGFTWSSYFEFPTQSNKPPQVTVTGLSSSIFDPTFGDYSSGSVFMTNTGQTKTTKILSNASFTTITLTLAASGFPNVYLKIRVSDPTQPDSFDLGNDISGASPNQYYYAPAQFVSGLGTVVKVKRSSGDDIFSVKVNNGSYVTLTTTGVDVSNGDVVKIRALSANASNTSKSGTLQLGSVSDTWSITTGGPELFTLIGIGKTTGDISLKGDVSGFYSPDRTGSVSLTEYRKGGSYIPDIPENSGVPSSGEISLGNIRGSYTYFSFDISPSSKTTSKDSTGTSVTMNVQWTRGTDFSMGFGDIDSDCEFRYTWSPTVQEISGTATSYTLTSATGSPGTYSTSNTWVRVNLSASSNSNVILYGTLTVYARYKGNISQSSTTFQLDSYS